MPKSPPHHRSVWATQSGPSPTAWHKATCRCRHARGFLPDHPGHLERRRDRPHADPGRAFAELATPARSCRAACRCDQPPARRARWRGRQSTAFQRVQHQAQRGGLHTTGDPEAMAAGKLDLDDVGGGQWRCRVHSIRLDDYRHKLGYRRCDWPIAETLAPGKNLIGVDVVVPRNDRYRRPGCKRSRDDLSLEGFRPRPMSAPDPRTCVH